MGIAMGEPLQSFRFIGFSLSKSEKSAAFDDLACVAFASSDCHDGDGRIMP